MTAPDSMLLPSVALPPRRVWVAGPAGPRPTHWADKPPRLRVPGSKYYTLRYLLIALLAEGESLVRGPALADDTAVLVRALRALGAEARWVHDDDASGNDDEVGWSLRVRGTGGRLRLPADGTLEVGNAGAVLRVLLGLGALLPAVRFTTDHPDSLGRRPNRDLLDALAALGIQSEADGAEGRLPIALRGGPPAGGAVAVSGARSSQFLSALLLLAPLLPRGLEITVVDDLRSAPLARATLGALRAAGIQVEAAADLRRFRVPGGQRYRAGTYVVGGDAPSAAALLAAAATLGRGLRLVGLDPTQEDVAAVVAALRALGADLHWRTDAAGMPELALAAGTALRGATLDGDAILDSVPVLAAAACSAVGPTRFERVATLRLKESDRIGDLCAELGRAGAELAPEATSTAGPDVIVVRGRPEGLVGGAEVAGHDDHRLVQALAIAALRGARGLTIDGADAVAKSYPGFFDDLRRLGARVDAL